MAATTTFTPPSEYPSDYAVVDVETTGFGAGDRVVSVAVVLLDGTGTQIGSWNSLVDPGCDPGRSDIHGLTAELLTGQPMFEQIAAELAELLRDRVVVAHNASFDCRMIEAEYRRLGLAGPAGDRLCTVTLAKRLELPLPDWRLPSLAAHYGVAQTAHHDAVDDAWTLSEIFRLALRDAAEAGLPLPISSGGERRDRVPAPRRAAPARARQACPYANPGPMTDGRLTQGMRVAFTGAGSVPREELVRRATDAGLAVTSSVSRRTSVLVTDDPGGGSAKNRQAARLGVPTVPEAVFLGLLGSVRPGVPVGTRNPAVRRPSGAAVPRRRDAATRVLVLHDQSEHEAAGVIRARAVERGHLVRVNLTRSIDVVVVLPGAAGDVRVGRAAALGVPCVTAEEWHARHAGDPPPSVGSAAGSGPRLLPRGGAVDLGGGARPGVWTLTASWRWDRPETDVDVVAFVLGEDEKVRRDEDFVFWNQPTTPDGVVTRDVAGPCEQGVTVDLDAVPPAVHRIVVAAVTDGEGGSHVTFDAVGAIEVETAPFHGAAFTRSTLDAATVERVLLLGEFYRRGVGWRFRAQGQGHEFGLAELARSYGVRVD